MKNKLHISLLVSLMFCSMLIAQTTYYFPGTGTMIKELNFENTSLLNQDFNYGSGWAGNGFGLSGTQRGAPEYVSVIANPEAVPSSGNQVLAFYSFDRDATWYTANPSAVGTTVYGGADPETQDDFFMYGASWVASETPSVMMHVFLPSSVGSSGVTSLRMPVKYNSGTNSWPGIWCYGDVLYLRGPGRPDIVYTTNAANGGKDTWWTLGLSITPNGDIQYYATPSFETTLSTSHFIGSNSDISAQTSLAYNPVDENSDAIIMSSNRNLSTTPTLIDRLYYTKGTTTQVLSVKAYNEESITLYPNPTTDYIFVKGLRNIINYTIYDNLGRIVKVDKASKTLNKIDVTTLHEGIYLLSLEGFKSKAFVKK